MHNIIEGDEVISCETVDFFKHYDELHYSYKLKQPKQDTISISDGDKAEHFAKFGFEVPTFSCELLKAKDSGDVLGIIQEETHEEIATWSKTNGSCVIHSTLVKPYTDYRYNLTPLKPKQWYEDENKSPYCVMMENDGVYEVNILYYEDIQDNKMLSAIKREDGIRLATTKERDSLYTLDSEVWDERYVIIFNSFEFNCWEYGTEWKRKHYHTDIKGLQWVTNT